MKSSIFTLLILPLLAGCVYEDLSDCPPTVRDEYVVVRVIDLQSKNDITEDALATNRVMDAVLFLFDSDGRYIDRLEIDQANVTDTIQLPIATRAINRPVAYVSAWANIKGPIVDDGSGGKREPADWLDIVPNESIDAPFLCLLPNGEDYHMCPGEMFFGLTDLRKVGVRDDNVTVHEVDITQKNARLSITVIGLPPGQDDNYYFEMCNQNYGYDFLGNPTPDDLEIREVGTFNQRGWYVSPAPFYLIHSEDPDNTTEEDSVVVNLYRESGTRADDTLVATTNKEQSTGDFIDLEQGMTTNVLMHIGSTGRVHVQVVVTPWNEVHQWEIS